jgi:two-component system, chemotaxis family, chemotaxis protein CheY
MKIMVVDDSSIMRRIINTNLRAAGFTDIIEATNGAEAIQSLAGVNLVLTDWNMPVMNGLSLVKEIRKQPEHSGLPIIMVTTEGAKTEVMEALRQGVNNYIVKPFTPETLIEKVNATLGKS